MSAVTLEGPVGKKRAYRVRWRFRGQRPRKSLGSVSATEGNRRRDEIEETLRLINSGRLQIPRDVDATEFVFCAGRLDEAQKGTNHTLQDAIDAYLESRKGKIVEETYNEYEGRLRCVRDIIGGVDRPIDSIVLHDLQTFVERRQSKVAGDTIKRDLTRFFDMYRLADAKGRISRPLDFKQVMTIIKPTLHRKKKKPD